MSSNSPTTFLTGIDVSHYQGAIRWDEVKAAGYAFAFAKATEGAGVVDPMFAANWNGMQAAGILRGAYHFYRAEQDAAAQAQHFVQTVHMADGDLPPVIDIEVNDGVVGAPLVSGVQTWLETVEQQTGVRPIIYTAASFWDAHFPAQFGQYPLWIAHYGPHPTPLPGGWTTWAFWQYSQSLPAGGVHGAADHDYFNGQQSELLAFVAASRTTPQTA
jgi:lysozyme